MENAIKDIIQEVTICQLSGEEYKFKCAVCGKTHRASSIKSISKCLSNLQAPHFNGTNAEEIYYSKETVLWSIFPAVTINILLPGISIDVLYEKSEDLISFIRDYCFAFFEGGSITISESGKKICYGSCYKYELPVNKPYLFLIKEFEQYISQHISAEYKKMLQKGTEEAKSFLNNIAQAVIDHIDLFTYNSNLKSAAEIEFTDMEAKIMEISAKAQQVTRNVSQAEIIDLIYRLISSCYHPYTGGAIQHIKDVGQNSNYLTYSTYHRNIYALSKRNKPEMRILIALENKYSNGRYTTAEKKSLIDEIAREILPIEDIVQKALDAASS